jgi:hypothetical protein
MQLRRFALLAFGVLLRSPCFVLSPSACLLRFAEGEASVAKKQKHGGKTKARLAAHGDKTKQG